MRKKKIVTCSISGALVLMILAVGILSSGFTNWNISKWLKGDAPITIAFDDKGNELVEGTVYPLSRSMIFRTLDVETYSGPATITLEALPTPFYATDVELEWRVEWVDPLSQWFSYLSPDPLNPGGIPSPADYVSVTPRQNNSFLADVAFVAAFGEQIKLIVSWKDNPAISDECIIDCLADVRKAYVKGDRVFGNNPSLNDSVELMPAWSNNKYILDDSALEQNVTLKNIGVEIIADNPRSSYTMVDDYTFTVKCANSPEYATILKNISGINITASGVFDKVESNYFSYSLDQIFLNKYGSNMSNDLLKAAVKVTSEPILKIKIECVGTYTSFTLDYGIYINPSWSTTLFDLTLDQSTAIMFS